MDDLFVSEVQEMPSCQAGAGYLVDPNGPFGPAQVPLDEDYGHADSSAPSEVKRVVLAGDDDDAFDKLPHQVLD
jgi:hypothetical protein